MAYNVLSHGLICLETGCEFEVEMDVREASQVLELERELICA
jgi:hypothetical protein